MAFLLFVLPKGSVKTAAVLLLFTTFCVSARAQSASTLAGDALPEITTALRSHDFDRALRITDVALRRTPRDPRLLTLRGMAYAGAGKPALSLAAYRQALNVSPDYLAALEGAAQLEYPQGSDRAKPFLLRILKLRPNDPTAHAMLAAIDYRSRDCKGAVEHFQRADGLLQNQPDALMEYGACLGNLKRSGQAIGVLQQAVDLAPENAVARYNLALMQWNASQPDDALKTLGPLLNVDPAPEDVLTLAADIYESKNDTQHTVELLRKAIVTHPTEKAAYLQFATLSYNHASVQVGIDMLNAGLTELPNEAELYLFRGVLYCQLGDMAKGMADLETANRLNPNLYFVGDAESMAESQAHNVPAAIEILRAKARLHPDNALTQYLLAEALSKEDAAVGSPVFREEVHAATLAAKLNPSFAAARDLLASIELRTGELGLAIEQSEAALRTDPKDQQALYHLILAKRQTRQKTEIPALLARFMEARKEAQAENEKVKVYPLVEEPTLGQPLAPR